MTTVSTHICRQYFDRGRCRQTAAAAAAALPATRCLAAAAPAPPSWQRQQAQQQRDGCRPCAAERRPAPAASPGAGSSSSGRMPPASAAAAAVDIAIEPGPVPNSRCIWAGVDIEAPPEAVFAALTSYETLQSFIPGLAENRCLERRRDGCTLQQAGEQQLGLGVRFCARVVLRIHEWPAGMPRRLLARSPTSGGGGAGAGGGPWWPLGASSAVPGYFGGLLGSVLGSTSSTGSAGSSGSEGEEAGAAALSPDDWCARCWLRPRSPLGAAPSMDISFDLVEGDFAAFKGLWRIQGRPGPGPPACRLSYSLFVRPQPWLPVHLVEPRIQAEVCANLAAVRTHVEGLASSGRQPAAEPPPA